MGSSRGKQGSKRDRECLRHDMLGRGASVSDIAAEMVVRWRFNPRQAWRYAHGLSQEEAASRYNAILGDDHSPMTGKRVSDYESWPHRGIRPTLHVLTLFAQAYRTTPRALLGDDELPLLPESERILLDKLASPPDRITRGELSTVAGHAVAAHAGSAKPLESAPPEHPAGDALTPDAIRRAACASGEHAEYAEVSEIAPVTLERLNDAVVRLARTYIGVEPDEIFDELVHIRDRIYRLLRHRAYPAQQADLYLLAGQTCGLLASASLELGCHDAAADQTRAAWAYAEIIDHNGLRAWVRGTQALITFWSGDPRKSVRLAASGRDYLRYGTGFVRLCNIESRGWAYLGDRRETQRVIAMGHRARDHTSKQEDLHDLIGGEFGFDEARQSFCNAGAYVHLGEPDLAIQASERALRLYASEAERHRRYGGEGSTRLEMTDAHLMDHALDAAETALSPVIDAPTHAPVAHLPTRLTEIHTTLNQPPYRHSREARELAERIHTFRSKHIAGAAT